MDKQKLKSIGISDTELELMQKVRETMNGQPVDDMEEVYQVCAQSGKFTDDELRLLKGKGKKSTTSFWAKIIKMIKKLFRK